MEQVLGMIYGLALGDALGSPVEFWELKGIRERYGPDGIQELPEPALFTDDTQMTLAVAEALIAAGHQDLGGLMAAISQEFVAWLHSPENDRSPGGSCLYGARQLEAGALQYVECGRIIFCRSRHGQRQLPQCHGRNPRGHVEEHEDFLPFEMRETAARQLGEQDDGHPFRGGAE